MHHTYTSVLSWSKGCNLKHPSKSNESITWISHLKYIFSLTEPEEGNQLERNSGKGTHFLHLDQVITFLSIQKILFPLHSLDHWQFRLIWTVPPMPPFLSDFDWSVLMFWAHLGCTESVQSQFSQCRLTGNLNVFTDYGNISLGRLSSSWPTALTDCSVLCGYIAGTKYAVLAAIYWAMWS